MKIKAFRYITTNDLVDLDFHNWSRVFEYAYILNELKKDNTIKSVHNTSCGGWLSVHRQFIDKLNELEGKEIINSDIKSQNVKNFQLYNILDKSLKQYDCVINVSTLEDFQNYGLFEIALTNLLEMANKRLIVTIDDNGREIGFIQKFFNIPISLLDDTNALRGSNSIYPEPSLNYLKIILLDIEK